MMAKFCMILNIFMNEKSTWIQIKGKFRFKLTFHDIEDIRLTWDIFQDFSVGSELKIASNWIKFSVVVTVNRRIKWSVWKILIKKFSEKQRRRKLKILI